MPVILLLTNQLDVETSLTSSYDELEMKYKKWIKNLERVQGKNTKLKDYNKTIFSNHSESPKPHIYNLKFQPISI